MHAQKMRRRYSQTGRDKCSPESLYTENTALSFPSRRSAERLREKTSLMQEKRMEGLVQGQGGNQVQQRKHKNFVELQRGGRIQY